MNRKHTWYNKLEQMLQYILYLHHSQLFCKICVKHQPKKIEENHKLYMHDSNCCRLVSTEGDNEQVNNTEPQTEKRAKLPGKRRHINSYFTVQHW